MRILEPAVFERTYAIAPIVDKRTKAGKEEWERFAAENEGKLVISRDDVSVMDEMAQAMHKCHLADDLLHDDMGQVEVPIFWTDTETGERCKAKLDRLITGIDGKRYVVDYKTTTSADTERFNHEVFKLGYYMQAAMYSEGVMRALELDYMPTFLFVAQEKKAPYSVNVIEVSEDVMKIGTEKFHTLLQKYHECKAVDIWPGYVDDVANETQLPGWWSLEEEEE